MGYVGSMRRVLHEVLVGQLTPMPWPRVAACAIVVALLILFAQPSTFAYIPRLTEDGHGMDSLSVAVNRSFCGVPSGLSSGEQLGRIFFGEPATNDQTVRQVIESRWGSLERYCETVTTPFINTENSLMLVESWAWRVAPNLTLRALGRVLFAVKVGFLLFFGIVFLRLGASALLCYAVLDAAFAILGRLQLNFGFSTYSFLLCSVMATLALYPMMLTLPSHSQARQFAWPAVAGAWSAFVVNMRTSYLPICAGLAMLYIVVLMLRSDDAGVRLSVRLRRVVPAVLVFLIGYATFQYVFIVRSRGAGRQFSYHTVFHPLVLSVGIPKSDLSEREGIEWNDAVGLMLAHRVDPSARYLSKEYERALAAYYVDLWKRYPGAMSRIYLAKARLAGTEMMNVEDVSAWPVAFSRGVLRRIPTGVRLLALLVSGTAIAAWLFVRRRAPMLLLVVSMGVTATMLMIESIVIVPRYYLSYHASLLLLFCSLTLLFVQSVFSGIASPLLSAAPRPERSST